MALALPLGGCIDAPGNTGTWVLAVLTALLAGAGGYALGWTRTRLRTESALREARGLARQQQGLQDGWAWQTDARHCWRPNGVAGLAEQAHAALLAHASVQARLQSRRAFTDLRVELPTAQAGSRTWLLRAVPCEDDVGDFSGFLGLARPADAADSAQAEAAALQPLLGLLSGPALLALDHGAGWQLARCNPAAAVCWPGLAPGAALPGALGALPESIVAAFAGPAAVTEEDWRVWPCSPMPAGARGLLLLRSTPVHASPNAAAAAAAAAAATSAAAAESDSFSFTVSHDLRAPIRVVEGFTRIVKEDYGRLLDRVGNDHLDRVLGAAARMNLMIDALLTLARLSSQPLARQPVNLSQLAGYVIDDLRRAAPEREAEIEIEPGLTTQGDPTLLRLVLENLLGNAWKYSARCARTRISLTQVPHGNDTAFAVRDNGTGFDMRSADRLFGLFQRLHSASEFPGHGVGLASVRRIVRRHGGEIWAEAEAGRGAVFYFTLAG